MLKNKKILALAVIILLGLCGFIWYLMSGTTPQDEDPTQPKGNLVTFDGSELKEVENNQLVWTLRAKSMKLNPDCMRDVLFAVEATPFGAHITEKELSAWLPQWSKDDIIYSCIQLGKAQYLEVEEKHYIRSYGVEVHDLTPQGHLALNNIPKDTI